MSDLNRTEARVTDQERSQRRLFARLRAWLKPGGSIVFPPMREGGAITKAQRDAARASLRHAMTADDEDRFYRSHKDGTCGCMDGGY